MLEQLDRQLPPDGGPPVTLIGSSLAARWRFSRPPVRRRESHGSLLAPAVMFAKPGHHLLPPERIDEWRRRGSLPFFHYAANQQLELDYAFYEDSLRYDPFHAVVPQPVDLPGPPRCVSRSSDRRAVCQRAPNVTLSLLDDDHQLIASLPRMWNDIQPFLGLVE